MNSYPSILIENAVNEISRLPGIGKRTALRLVLYLLKQDESVAESLSDKISMMRKNIKFCNICNSVSDDEICYICSKSSRDKSIICVVEDIKDIMAIESTEQYNGVYHVLGGIISPIDGIGPEDINISSLIARVETGAVKEIIMALSTTMEGDTTIYYIYKKLRNHSLKYTTIARGVAVGDDLEFVDEVTLGRSIINRLPYEINV